MNPFEWRGPEFLGLYFGLFVVVLFTASLLRFLLHVPTDTPRESPRLSPYQVAFLSSGPWLAFAAALTRLVQSGQIVEQSGKFARDEGASATGQPLERRLLRSTAEPTDLVTLFGRARVSLASLRKSLQKLGLLMTDAAEWRTRWVPALLLAALAVFGLVKIIIGLQRDRAVAFLIVGVIGASVASLTLLFRRGLRSRRGDAMLARLKTENAALGDTLRAAPHQLGGPELAMGVGLFGVAALTNGPYAGLHQQFAANRITAAGTGCGGGGCGDHTCASSCGGGSGCGGGGGCGGCGGGGGD